MNGNGAEILGEGRSSNGHESDFDVVIIGGGPAGATLGCLLAMDGYRALIVEKDIHPRDHVGESMVPANNFVMHRMGFLSKMEEAGLRPQAGGGLDRSARSDLERRVHPHVRLPAPGCGPDLQLQRGA